MIPIQSLRNVRTTKIRLDDANDVIDEIIDAIVDESGGSKCIDVDTVRSVISRYLVEGGE